MKCAMERKKSMCTMKQSKVIQKLKLTTAVSKENAVMELKTGILSYSHSVRVASMNRNMRFILKK